MRQSPREQVGAFLRGTWEIFAGFALLAAVVYGVGLVEPWAITIYRGVPRPWLWAIAGIAAGGALALYQRLRTTERRLYWWRRYTELLLKQDAGQDVTAELTEHRYLYPLEPD